MSKRRTLMLGWLTILPVIPYLLVWAVALVSPAGSVGWSLGIWGVRVLSEPWSGMFGPGSERALGGFVLVQYVLIGVGLALLAARLTQRAAARWDICEHCQYNLRGLRHDAPCPECGKFSRYRAPPSRPARTESRSGEG